MRVEVEHAERLVPALHRHADHLADAEADDALPGVEALIAARRRRPARPAFLEHVVHDRPAQGDLLLVIDLLAPADGLGLELAGVVVAQHDAAAVGVDGAEDQLHDALEQLIEVEDVADGLDGLVHDAEVGQRVFEPGSAGLLRLRRGCGCLRSRRWS